MENGIDPVYVLEGKAPELKAQVMKKRREARFRENQASSGECAGTSLQTVTQSNSTGRSKYQYIQKECTELLHALGVVTITSKGEAEAACAGLNHQGAVDGCITVDGDAFLYGAKTVYRNLSTDLSSFVCQEYSMDLIETRLNLSRDKLIAMAILFGCDYLPEGIPGVGKDSALRVLSKWKNGQALDVLRSWQTEEAVHEIVPSRPIHCSQCKHPGSLRSHAKSGCKYCDDSSTGCRTSNDACRCDWHEKEVHYEELAIRAKIFDLKELKLDEIFEEFKNEVHLQRKGGAILPWQMPCIKTFVQIATKKLKWEPRYATEKVLPLLSRWVIIHGNSEHEPQIPVTPLVVLKSRVKRGCPMYEIEWKFNKEIEHFPTVFQTLEPQFLIQRKYPYLIPQPIQKPLKATRAKNKNNPKKANLNTKKSELDMVAMFKNMTIEKEQSSHPSLLSDSNILDLTGGTDDSDISVIIQDICSRKKKAINRGHDCDDKSLSNQRTRGSVFKSSSAPLPTELIGNHAKSFSDEYVSEDPLPNFSLNFSLGKLLGNTNNSIYEHELNEGRSNDICSTPLKSSDSRNKAEQDSFSTPSPLIDRFGGWRL